jgi:hypothetical protein
VLIRRIVEESGMGYVDDQAIASGLSNCMPLPSYIRKAQVALSVFLGLKK